MQSVGDYEYRQGELIGHGAFALVYKGHHKQTGTPVAIKQILLKNIPTRPFSIRQEEISILKQLKHNNIVQLYYYHETPAEIYLVMEYCNGGDLADYLQSKKTLSEVSIRHLTRHIAEALQVIHQKHIIHRDVKPQNLLLSFPSRSSQNFRDTTIKLADFGFARYLSGTDMAATLCGSPLYMAPEILLGERYDYKVDLWSAGTILYQCLTGFPPFDADNPHALRRRYARETLVPRIPNGTSEALADLLLKLMKKKPQERLTFQSLISHSFLQSGFTQKASLQDYSPPSLHAKSSPVPIHRRQYTTESGYTIASPHTSPNAQAKQESLGTSSNKYFSPSSGPPSLHKIGSSSSITRYYASPPTKDIDEDFVLVSSKAGDSRFNISPGSQGSSRTPSSFGSLPRQSNFCGPLSEPRPLKQTPPTSISPILARQDTPPFSSLFKLMGGAQSGTITQSPVQATHQATPLTMPLTAPSSTNSSPSTKYSGSPGSSRRSLPISHQGSAVRLSILHEVSTAPQLVDSTDLMSPSLLMSSDVLGKGFDNLLVSGVQLRPGNLFDQSQENERKDSWRQNDKQVELSELSGSVSPESEEMFSLQLDEDVNDRSLLALTQSILIGRELLKLAKSRQGPMLLLSSSMGDSGGMLDHAQRFSEQLILCVKAANVVEIGCREYELSLAANSLEPLKSHTTAFDEAQELLKDCLEKAQLARELYSKCYGKKRRPSVQTKMTAERLIFLQAVDMCKQAVLEEGIHRNESKKRYYLSKILLQLLLSDAKTEKDRMTIKKYLTRIQSRLKLLSNVPVQNKT